MRREELPMVMLALGMVIGLGMVMYLFEKSPSSVAYNKQQCAVVGYAADCKTKLEK